ncbi:MAG: hypothetical protein F7C35_03435 [Desulfurococcales archaeon]|nr:hypothetical protein [Desulfurococcales archaeon]
MGDREPDSVYPILQKVGGGGFESIRNYFLEGHYSRFIKFLGSSSERDQVRRVRVGEYILFVNERLLENCTEDVRGWVEDIIEGFREECPLYPEPGLFHVLREAIRGSSVCSRPPLAVVGYDRDTRKLFAHVPPESLAPLLSLNPESLRDGGVSEGVVRALLGFTHHRWEVEDLKPGLRVRVQGDLVLEVLGVFSDNEDLVNALASLKAAYRAALESFKALSGLHRGLSRSDLLDGLRGDEDVGVVQSLIYFEARRVLERVFPKPLQDAVRVSVTRAVPDPLSDHVLTFIILLEAGRFGEPECNPVSCSGFHLQNLPSLEECLPGVAGGVSWILASTIGEGSQLQLILPAGERFHVVRFDSLPYSAHLLARAYAIKLLDEGVEPEKYLGREETPGPATVRVMDHRVIGEGIALLRAPLIEMLYVLGSAARHLSKVSGMLHDNPPGGVGDVVERLLLSHAGGLSGYLLGVEGGSDLVFEHREHGTARLHVSRPVLLRAYTMPHSLSIR